MHAANCTVAGDRVESTQVGSLTVVRPSRENFPNAYLNADIGEDMYMRQASGLEYRGKEGWVYKLKKALYGSPVSGHRWHNALQGAIETLGYSRSTIDHCLFHRFKEGHRDLLIIYVDDVLVTSTGGKTRSDAQLGELGTKFNIKKLGLATHMLGIGVHQGDDYTALDQTAYLKTVLSEAKYIEAKPRATPWDPYLREEEELLNEKETTADFPGYFTPGSSFIKT